MGGVIDCRCRDAGAGPGGRRPRAAPSRSRGWSMRQVEADGWRGGGGGSDCHSTAHATDYDRARSLAAVHPPFPDLLWQVMFLSQLACFAPRAEERSTSCKPPAHCSTSEFKETRKMIRVGVWMRPQPARREDIHMSRRKKSAVTSCCCPPPNNAPTLYCTTYGH